ncbi:copper amine oxidase N-terminal domain-containing protein [Paenibacillus macerans]|uniref:copper amine oxidase N-terminal domain-containing protein n=1 Tax=Paenibacillus macerans TaxID=44252 RepID=UPI00203B829D|nr:copper amine oxidase N-terminal domain-containing protein [Paenibacillus macerans]MCM3701628.1 copper amine oxidase N-terminal domain-containing protein [Paenibacillus macerans]
MKKQFGGFFLLFVLMFLFFSNSPHAGAVADSPKLYLDGRPLSTQSGPVIFQDTTMLPLRAIAEQLGFKVSWSNSTKEVRLKMEILICF